MTGILLIDIGNTRLKWWYHSDAAPLSAQTEPHALAHQGEMPVAALMRAWQNLHPQSIRVSHVAGDEMFEQLQEVCAQLWGNIALTRIRAHSQHPLLTLNYNPQQMGGDRYAQILGAQTLAPQRAHIIISAGTALTIDGVRAGGQHIGGIISAGARLQRLALAQYTAKLPVDGGHMCMDNAPDNTHDALATGVLLNCVGVIEQFVQRYFEQPPLLLLCGGDAPCLIEAFDVFNHKERQPYEWQHVPALCLLGLLSL